MEGCGIRAGDRFLAQRARRDHALAGLAHPALAGHHHLRRGQLRPRAPRPVGADAHPGLARGQAGLRLAGALHALQPAAHHRGRAGPGPSDRQRPLRPAGQRRLRRGPREPARAIATCRAPARARLPGPRWRTASDGVRRQRRRLGTVTPIALHHTPAGARRSASARDPQAIALTPDDRTAFVVNAGSDTRHPDRHGDPPARAPIRVGDDPRAIAITPDGATAYVANSGSDTVTPISTRTGTAAGSRSAVGADPRTLAITPDGRTLYVLDWGGAAVTPIEHGHQPGPGADPGRRLPRRRGRRPAAGAPSTWPATAPTR